MSTKEHDPLEDLVRLQIMQLRREAGSQAELIVELEQAGFGQPRIAELLGTTTGTVRVAIQRARNRKKSSNSTSED